MGGFRAERLAELIHRELAVRLQRDIKDPRVVPISITRVEVTRDLRRAVIHYLPLGGGPASDELQAALKDAAGRLRGPIGRAVRIHHAPELVFELDVHSEAAFRVTELLAKLNPPQATGGDESAEEEPESSDEDRP